MEPVVEIRGLTKRFGEREVLRGIDLEVPPGCASACSAEWRRQDHGTAHPARAVAGLGRRGAGVRLPMPESGRAVRARCGVVPQADNLDPDFTVIENLHVYARYFGLARAQVEERVRELLDFVELGDRADSPIATLSGGMKRRLTIAAR